MIYVNLTIGMFSFTLLGVWLIFATNWGFILLGMCAVYHAVIVVQSFCHSREGNISMFG